MKMKTSVAVYGSGISGLIATYYLNKEGFRVSVIDPYKDPKIQSLKMPEGLVERAANSILHNDEVKGLLNDIGLEYELYSDLGKKKYIFLNDKPRRWPLSFLETLKSIKRLIALGKKKPEMKPFKGETISAWGARAIGSTLLNNLMIPGLQGVYGADTGNLSASLVLKNFFTKGKKRSLGSLSFKNGMQQFSDHLKSYLIKEGVEFVEESQKDFDLKVVSSPSHSLPDFVSADVKTLLSDVTYKKVSTLTVFVKAEDRMSFEGFGCVFKDQSEGFMGLILNSDLFDNRAKEGLSSETWIFDGNLVKTEKEALKRLKPFRENKFQRTNKIANVYFKHWNKAFPSYDLKLEEILNELSIEVSKNKGIHYFANWTGNLGIGSMIQAGPGFVKEIVRIKDCHEA